MNPRWPAAAVPVFYLAAGALVVSVLSRAEAVLMPLALAILVSFVLRPPAERLERIGVPRMIAVAGVVLLALGVVGGFGYVLNRQFDDLASQMPTYSREIRAKLAALRGSGGAMARIQNTMDRVSRELDQQEAKQLRQAPEEKGSSAPLPPQEIPTVRVLPAEPSDIERFRGLVEPILEPLAKTGVVLVLTIFILLGREDLRDRLIRLVGRGRVPVTTRTLDEAADRITSYLVTQSLINSAFAAVVTLGLMWIGLPYALLWGVTAGLLRFVPYVGAIIALIIPTALAFVQFHGWGETAATVGLFLSLDAITANLIEPLVVGHRTGVPSIALLISALFWTWLWGPVGLVVSTPLTVCLAVLGKHVSHLEFLAVLLEDAPALEPEVSFYQRLLAHDDDEASDIAEQQLQSTSRQAVFDSVIVPAVVWAARDREREEIVAADYDFVVTATREIVQQLSAKQDAAAAPATGPPEARVHARVLGVPARNAADELALEMLALLLDPLSFDTEQLSTTPLASELINVIESQRPDLACIAALPPGGFSHARYLCKRLRVRFPELRILVIRPAQAADVEKVTRRLLENGANAVANNLGQACAMAADLLGPVLVAAANQSAANVDHNQVKAAG